jgi:hypothetical protein
VHGTEGGFGLLAGARPAVPLVVSLQGILRAYQRAYFSGRSAGEIARLVASAEFVKGRGVVHRYILLRRQAVREARIMREARCFIGRTAWDREVLAAVNPAAAYYHCDEIMRPQFAASTWKGSGSRGASLFTTSSALMGKGTECLLEACSLLRSRGAECLTDRSHRARAILQCDREIGRHDALPVSVRPRHTPAGRFGQIEGVALFAGEVTARV